MIIILFLLFTGNKWDAIIINRFIRPWLHAHRTDIRPHLTRWDLNWAPGPRSNPIGPVEVHSHLRNVRFLITSTHTHTHTHTQSVTLRPNRLTRRAILFGKLALTYTPDPIRPPRRGPDHNRCTRQAIFRKLALTRIPDPNRPTRQACFLNRL